MSSPTDDHDLAAGLRRIGEEAINKSNDALLAEYFAEDYVFHGPQGELTRQELWRYFAALRESFTGFTIRRDHIIRDGNYLAARNTFTGVFDREFRSSPIGTVQPTGKRATWKVMNFFRYDDEGRLAEEWVQTDNLSFLRELGVDIGRR